MSNQEARSAAKEYGDLREAYLDAYIAAEKRITRLLDALELISGEAVTLGDAQRIAREVLADA